MKKNSVLSSECYHVLYEIIDKVVHLSGLNAFSGFECILTNYGSGSVASVGINRRLLPSALAGIDRRLFHL
jgi:hypothetical protein